MCKRILKKKSWDATKPKCIHGEIQQLGQELHEAVTETESDINKTRLQSRRQNFGEGAQAYMVRVQDDEVFQKWKTVQAP